MSIETVRLILEFGAFGVLALVLWGLFVLLKTFAPPFIAAWVALTSALTKLGEQIENLSSLITGIGVDVRATKAGVERSGAYAQVNPAGEPQTVRQPLQPPG